MRSHAARKEEKMRRVEMFWRSYGIPWFIILSTLIAERILPYSKGLFILLEAVRWITFGVMLHTFYWHFLKPLWAKYFGGRGDV